MQQPRLRRDLHRELLRRGHDDQLQPRLLVEACEQRRQEGDGLAAARRGVQDHVVAVRNELHGLALDRHGLVVAGALQLLKELLRDRDGPPCRVLHARAARSSAWQNPGGPGRRRGRPSCGSRSEREKQAQHWARGLVLYGTATGSDKGPNGVMRRPSASSARGGRGKTRKQEHAPTLPALLHFTERWVVILAVIGAAGVVLALAAGHGAPP